MSAQNGEAKVQPQRVDVAQLFNSVDSVLSDLRLDRKETRLVESGMMQLGQALGGLIKERDDLLEAAKPKAAEEAVNEALEKKK